MYVTHCSQWFSDHMVAPTQNSLGRTAASSIGYAIVLLSSDNVVVMTTINLNWQEPCF